MNHCDIQLTSDGKLKHLVSIEGLTPNTLEQILDTANKLLVEHQKKKTKSLPLLRGKTVVNLFFEDSTRTRTTFEMAAQRLSADVINLDISRSSTSKGESLSDTLRTVEAMGADIFVVRHHDSGTPSFIAQSVTPGVGIINAGDGKHAHPTQAMLDMMTIRSNKGSFEPLSIAIVGDIANSRVARSDIQALRMLGAKDIRLLGPATMLPNPMDALEAKTSTSIEQGLEGVDVIIILRIQKERAKQDSLIASEEAYFADYGLTKKRLLLAKPDAIVMHPGPINRNVEIASDVADGSQSVILQQVNLGVAVRMSVFSMVASTQELYK